MKPASALLSARDSVLGAKRLQAVELLDKRRASSKTFQLPNGERHLSQRAGLVHFDTGSGWEEIDLQWTATKDGWLSDKAASVILAFKDRVGWRHTSRVQGWAEIELVAVDGNAPVVKEAIPEDEVLVYSGVAPGVDIRVELQRDGAEAFKVLHQATELVWRVTTSKDFEGAINTSPTGKDATGDSLEIEATFDGDFLTERWTGRVSRVADARTRGKRWFTDPALPVVVDASINEHIAANGDDGEQRNVAWMSTPNSIRVGYTSTSGGNFHAGLRFQTIAVPNGATVSAATLTLNVLFKSGSPSGKLYADDVDDAAAWSAANKPTGITKTTATVNIAPAGTGTQVFDILSVVQEILGRGGWASSNDIRFGIFRNGGGLFAFEAIEHSGSNEAQLDITYTAGGPSALPWLYRAHTQTLGAGFQRGAL